MIEFTTFEFPHSPPLGYSYQFEQFNTRLISIWLLHSFSYSYTSKQIRTIWGFYNLKKKEYYAPINSTKVGDRVDIKDTRNYTAMQLNLTPLEKCFL